MTVTKQTYTATATWTASQLADIFRSAFIDAGLMTEWHDSFLSDSVENRILRVQYDASKAYGTTFYWFMFTTSGAFLHVATGWSTATDQPTGTQYLDFFATTTNTATNHWRCFTGVSSSTVNLIRYTSQADATRSWFVVTNGTQRLTFTISHATSSPQSWLNLDQGFYSGFYHLGGNTGLASGILRIQRAPALRRDITIGPALNGSTSSGNYSSNPANIVVQSYIAPGHQSNNYSTNIGLAMDFLADGGGDIGDAPGSIILPVGFSSSNPAYTSNSNPVFHSMPFTPYEINPLPADFGITFHYATNSFSLGDTFVVTSGVEEWEVLAFTSASSALTNSSPLFLARTV